MSLSTSQSSSEMYKILHPSFEPPRSSSSTTATTTSKSNTSTTTTSATTANAITRSTPTKLYKAPIATQQSSEYSYGLKTNITSASSATKQQHLRHTPIYGGGDVTASATTTSESSTRSQFNYATISNSSIEPRGSRKYHMTSESEQHIAMVKKPHANKKNSEEFVHRPTRKLVPEYLDRVKSEKQPLNRKAPSPSLSVKRDALVSAGMPSALQKPPTPTSKRRIEIEHVPNSRETERRIVNDIYLMEKARTMPFELKDPIAGVATEEIKVKSSVKTFEEKASDVDTVMFPRKGRTEPPVSSFLKTNPTTLPSGGIIPEDAKLGLRVKTEVRPRDHTADIKYEFSGGICPTVQSEGSAVDMKSIKEERTQYEDMIRRAATSGKSDQLRAYVSNRQRATNKSQVLSNFLYNTKP